jgi:hypothetical protein
MLSPFAGLSLITHLAICFLYKTVLFLYGLIGGLKGKTNTQLTVLVRAHNESILPPMIIGFVFSIIISIASFSVVTSYQNKPNTFDLVADAIGVTQTYEAPKTKSPSAPHHPPDSEKTMVAVEFLQN